MKSLTETIEKLITRKVSFIDILNKREIWNQSDAENVIKAAIANIKKNKKTDKVQVEAFEKEWQKVSVHT